MEGITQEANSIKIGSGDDYDNEMIFYVIINIMVL